MRQCVRIFYALIFKFNWHKCTAGTEAFYDNIFLFRLLAVSFPLCHIYDALRHTLLQNAHMRRQTYSLCATHTQSHTILGVVCCWFVQRYFAIVHKFNFVPGCCCCCCCSLPLPLCLDSCVCVWCGAFLSHSDTHCRLPYSDSRVCQRTRVFVFVF